MRYVEMYEHSLLTDPLTRSLQIKNRFCSKALQPAKKQAEGIEASKEFIAAVHECVLKGTKLKRVRDNIPIEKPANTPDVGHDGLRRTSFESTIWSRQHPALRKKHERKNALFGPLE